MNKGDLLSPLERAIEARDMVAYSGATWDWHPMHYDREWTERAGLPGPVVDGQMLGALMAKQLTDFFGPRAFITNLGFRFRDMVLAGDRIRCDGEIVAVDGDVVEVAQRVVVGDRLCVEGTGRVRLR